MSIDPYAPPKAARELPVPQDLSFDPMVERARWASAEGQVSAIGVAFYVPVLAFVFVIIGFVRATRGGAALPLFIGGALGIAALLAFGAHRLRQLRPEGRLIVTLFYAAFTALFFARSGSSKFLVFVIGPGLAIAYLWFGRGAHVLGSDHARAVAATPARPVPTALWGWLVFWGIAIIWSMVAIPMILKLLD